MKVRPVLFSAPMVRALLDGRKTQTRRLAQSRAKTGCDDDAPVYVPSLWQGVKPGDLLLVREAFHGTRGFTKPIGDGFSHLFGFEVPGVDRAFDVPGIGNVREFRSHLGGWGGCSSKNYPGMHMPRWISRLTLEVTATKIEPVQNISGEDAIAEGVEYETADPPFYYVPGIYPHSITAVGVEEPGGRHAARCYGKLWAHLHGVASWEANPEVVAITFAVHKCNVDQLLAQRQAA